MDGGNLIRSPAKIGYRVTSVFQSRLFFLIVAPAPELLRKKAVCFKPLTKILYVILVFCLWYYVIVKDFPSFSVLVVYHS